MHKLHHHPTSSLSQKSLSKQARRPPLVPLPTLSYSLSPTFSVSASRDLVFLFLSVRSCFYCAIFCHFGLRKGGRNAISPPLRPLLWGRVAWPVCWAGEKGGETGSRWALIHYWSAPIENLMEILPPLLLLILSLHPSLFLFFSPLLSSPPFPYLLLFPYVFFLFLCVSSLVSGVFLFFSVYPRSLQSVFSPSWMSLSTADHFLSLAIYLCAGPLSASMSFKPCL